MIYGLISHWRESDQVPPSRIQTIVLPVEVVNTPPTPAPLSAKSESRAIELPAAAHPTAANPTKDVRQEHLASSLLKAPTPTASTTIHTVDTRAPAEQQRQTGPHAAVAPSPEPVTAKPAPSEIAELDALLDPPGWPGVTDIHERTGPRDRAAAALKVAIKPEAFVQQGDELVSKFALSNQGSDFVEGRVWGVARFITRDEEVILVPSRQGLNVSQPESPENQSLGLSYKAKLLTYKELRFAKPRGVDGHFSAITVVAMETQNEVPIAQTFAVTAP